MNLLFLRSFLATVGKFVPETVIYIGDRVLNYLSVGRWFKQHRFAYSRFPNRECLFKHMASAINEDEILYLEFGVFEGESIRLWSRLLKDKPKAKLHGFDSFEGLPEDWNHGNLRGKFSTHGNLPEISDSRVEFFKGWFNESLSKYTLPKRDRLIINIDCDIYASAIDVLRFLKDKIQIGDIIYFDEFSDRHHELKAFQQFLYENPPLKFQCIGVTPAFVNCAFKRIA